MIAKTASNYVNVKNHLDCITFLQTSVLTRKRSSTTVRTRKVSSSTVRTRKGSSTTVRTKKGKEGE